MAAFVLCKTMIAMFSIETYYTTGDAFDNVGFHQEIGLETLYPSQWMLQASMVMAWPGMLHGWISGGLVQMVKDTYRGIVTGSFRVPHVHRQIERLMLSMLRSALARRRTAAPNAV